MKIDSSQRTLRGQAHEILRGELLSGRLQPGQRINEVAVAAEIGISRGPLREAIRNLEQEGLLVSAPHRGTFVRRMTVQDVEELQEVRLALETTAACRLAAHFGPAERDRLEAKLGAMRRAQAERWSLADRMAADLAFHEAVCEASGNETLLELWRSLVGRVTIMVVSVGEERMARLQDAAAHEPLVEAIASGDEEMIRETYRAVFEEGRRVVASAVAQASADGSAS